MVIFVGGRYCRLYVASQVAMIECSRQCVGSLSMLLHMSIESGMPPLSEGLPLTFKQSGRIPFPKPRSLRKIPCFAKTPWMIESIETTVLRGTVPAVPVLASDGSSGERGVPLF